MAKKIHDMTGLTVEQMLAKMEELTGDKVPDHIQEKVRDAHANGRPVLLSEHSTMDTAEIEAGHTDLGEILKGILGKSKTDAFEDELNDAQKDAFLKVAEKHHGPIPAYNGVFGDSHDCPACRYRRKLDGPDYNADMERDMSPRESEKAVQLGYFSENRDVPEVATRKHVEELMKLKRDAGRKEVDANIASFAPGARRGISAMCGDDSDTVQSFDKLMAIMAGSRGRDVSPAEQIKAQKHLADVLHGMLNAKGRED